MDFEMEIVKCDEKTKVKNVCGVITQETMTEHNEVVRGDVLNLKDKCKDNQICRKIEDDSPFYACSPKLNLLHKGDKCIFNQECRSQQCGGEKCQTVGSGQVCKDNWTCEPGYFCKDMGDNYKCTPVILGDTECTYEDFCEPGFICDPIARKCLKIGSFKESMDSNDPIFCQSGLIYGGKCVSVIRDSECQLQGDKYYCKPDISGSSGDVTVECASLNKHSFCPLSILKSDLFLKYVEKLEKVDYEKFNTNDKKRIDSNSQYYLNNIDTLKAYIKYQHMEELMALEVMNSEGKIDKNCEFNYYLKTMDMKFIKLSKFIFGLVLLVLL